MKIGLIGFGTVASGFYQLLKRYGRGLSVEIDSVAVRQANKPRGVSDLTFHQEPEALVTDPDIEVIIELIDDASAAKELVSRALENGKSVISANKKMIADNLEEVHRWHTEASAALLYEGAVGGGIPILNSLDRNLGPAEVTSIRGILNGSTNYILTGMQREGCPFDKALAQAQKLGFAESNPTLDISGMDAAYKLVILDYHARGYLTSPGDVIRQGIDSSTDVLSEKGLKTKSVSRSFRSEDLVVGLEILDREDPLYHVDDELNGIWLDTRFAGSHFFTGKGAGAWPTGLAVFNDLRFLLEGYKYRLEKT